LEIRGDDGTCLAEADSVIKSQFPAKGEQIATGRWVRFNTPPKSNNPREIWEQAIAIDKSLARPRVSNKSSDPDIIGILFPEETGWREVGDGWIFLFRIGQGASFFMARAGRAGRVDLQERNPTLKNLNTKKVAVFGLGCLGAPSTLELAKCGVGQLRILDHDIVDPGTIVRWPFGLFTAAGREKSITLCSIIRHDYPYTDITAYNYRIGTAIWHPTATKGSPELDILQNMISDADLVYDATANPMINNVLAMLCAEYGVPYILVAGTPGMWGGRIVRIRPNNTGCLHCYYHALTDEQIPTPATDEINGEVAPLGCSSATFTGTYFDASEIAMGGVRMAISTLMENTTGGYPSIPWDVAIVNLRDTAGNIVPPQWLTYRLPKHPKCFCSNFG
jgi:molybdopterin/thiamine biosynthesis adenylyltransferase